MTTTIASGRRIGATIGLGFGGLWALLGAQALPQHLSVWAALAGFAVSAALILRVWWARPVPSEGKSLFRRTRYFVAVALEVAAIMAASNLLPRYGLSGYLIPVVGVIVGLHFIGLWLAAAQRHFLGIAAGMCAVSLAAMLLPPGPREIACGFGNALVLWVGASLFQASHLGL